MLTDSFLQRFLFKWRYAILILAMISAGAAFLSSQINRWVPHYALSFSHLIAQQSQTQISFKSVHYRFPNSIVLKDIRVLEFEEKRPMFQASTVTMKFTLPLFSPAAPLREITVDGMAINYSIFRNYWIFHGKKIYEGSAKTFPKENIRLVVPNGQFYPKGFPQKAPINFKIDLTLNGELLNAHGSWDDKFNYELAGNIHNAGFDMDKFTLQDGQSSMNIWGSWRNNNMDWKGFAFYDGFYILDIAGNLKIQHKDILLKRLSFSIDGDAVGALGHCSREDLFQCDADITYLRRAQHRDLQRPLKDINLHFHVQNTLQGFLFTGSTDLDFLSNPSPASLQNIHVDFTHLKAAIINGNSLEFKIGHLLSIFSGKDDKYSIPFENLLGIFNFKNTYQKTITLSGRVLEGHGYSRIFVDTSSHVWQVKAQGKFEAVKANQGLLSGTFDLQSSETIRLSGALKLHNGNFDNTQLQGWIAKTLQMPSLNHVSGADMSCRFDINGNSKIIEGFKLDTDDFDLGGFFHIDGDDLVSAQGSVRFSKKLLSESEVGRHIISMVNGAWTLPFEFRLSGDLYRMNFQWDNSALKDKVRRHLFSFLERMIDQRMDAHPNYKVTIPNESVSP